MEFLPGETLYRRLQSGTLKPAEAFPIAQQIAMGLDAAHEAQVIHRDLKTGNVMLVPSSGLNGSVRAVITDFGLASAFDADGRDSRLTARGEVLGTPDYMSPEQVTGGRLTSATDIYSFGVVLYEMVTGALPFEGASNAQRALKRVREDPISPRKRVPELDRRWEAVILRCLERDPKRRFASATQVIAALETGLPRQWPRRNVLAGSALLLTTIGLAAALILGGRLREAPKLRPEAVNSFENGVRALHEGRFYSAAEWLQRATGLDPAYPLAHAALAQAWLELDYTDRAKDEILRAANPNTVARLKRPEQAYIQAIRLAGSGDLREAVDSFRAAVSDSTGKQKAYADFDLGRALERLEEVDQAVQAYSEAISIEPDYASRESGGRPCTGGCAKRRRPKRISIMPSGSTSTIRRASRRWSIRGLCC